MDETYTTTDDDAGHVITVIVTATNSAGDAGREHAADRRRAAAGHADPDADTHADPDGRADTDAGAHGQADPGHCATGARDRRRAAAPRLVTRRARPRRRPGQPRLRRELPSEFAGNAKYRRIKLRGIGTVRVRATPPARRRQLTPILVTTQISHGKTKHVRVRYTLDGRKLRAGRKPAYKAAITPSRLQRLGIHKLKATVGKGEGQAGEADRAHAQDRLLRHAVHRAALADDGGRRPAPADRRADGAGRPRLQGAGRAAAAPDRQAPHRRLHARLRRGPEPPASATPSSSHRRAVRRRC